MVLFKVHLARFAVFESERDTPGAVDVDRVSCRLEPVQCMEVESGDVHVFCVSRRVQRVQATQNPRMQASVDPPRRPCSEKRRQQLAAKSRDHATTVTQRFTVSTDGLHPRLPVFPNSGATWRPAPFDAEAAEARLEEILPGLGGVIQGVVCDRKH